MNYGSFFITGKGHAGGGVFLPNADVQIGFYYCKCNKDPSSASTKIILFTLQKYKSKFSNFVVLRPKNFNFSKKYDSIGDVLIN